MSDKVLSFYILEIYHISSNNHSRSVLQLTGLKSGILNKICAINDKFLWSLANFVAFLDSLVEFCPHFFSGKNVSVDKKSRMSFLEKAIY